MSLIKSIYTRRTSENNLKARQDCALSETISPFNLFFTSSTSSYSSVLFASGPIHLYALFLMNSSNDHSSFPRWLSFEHHTYVCAGIGCASSSADGSGGRAVGIKEPSAAVASGEDTAASDGTAVNRPSGCTRTSLRTYSFPSNTSRNMKS